MRIARVSTNGKRPSSCHGSDLLARRSAQRVRNGGHVVSHEGEIVIRRASQLAQRASIQKDQSGSRIVGDTLCKVGIDRQPNKDGLDLELTDGIL